MSATGTGKPGPCVKCGEAGNRRLIGETFAFLCDACCGVAKNAFYLEAAAENVSRMTGLARFQHDHNLRGGGVPIQREDEYADGDDCPACGSDRTEVHARDMAGRDNCTDCGHSWYKR